MFQLERISRCATAILSNLVAFGAALRRQDDPEDRAGSGVLYRDEHTIVRGVVLFASNDQIARGSAGVPASSHPVAESPEAVSFVRNRNVSRGNARDMIEAHLRLARYRRRPANSRRSI